MTGEVFLGAPMLGFFLLFFLCFGQGDFIVLLDFNFEQRIN